MYKLAITNLTSLVTYITEYRIILSIIGQNFVFLEK